MIELSANTVLSHYRILSKLGAGGMGEVYLAQDTKLDRKVALKVLPADVASSRDRMERFVREAKSAAALNHPNIAHVYEIGESDGTHYIAMEYIDGVTLREKIHHAETSLVKLLKYLTQVAEGLNKAHAAGIVHRDLKPDNIMITRDDYAKVLDFGLAKLVEPQKAFGSSGSSSEIVTAMMQQQSIAGMVMGTIGYMSPEQASGRVDEIDHRSDIFSFGCILFEAATGHRAFEGKDALDSLHKIVHAPTPQLKDVNPLAPDDLQRVVRRCLAKEADKRYQSMKEVAIEIDDLQEVLKSQTGVEYTTRPQPRTSTETSGATTSDEGLWVAVLPFKASSSNVEVMSLAEGLSEEIVTGLSRFSYLRVIARSSTLQYASESGDVRTVGNKLGARYTIEGSLRQAGSTLRLSVQLVDTTTGAHLWAETYNRTFSPETIFELQDDLVPRIVSTVADPFGALVHSLSESLRGRGAGQYTPHEAVLRSFGYLERATPEEHAEVREILETAAAGAPGHGEVQAELALVYWSEHSHGHNARPDPLGRALVAAQRAVAASPTNHRAQWALATVLFFRKDFQAFRPAAERALALNPMDGSSSAVIGTMIAYTGDWEYGIAVTERAKQLNPHHPGWYNFVSCYYAYYKRDYKGALDIALRVNMPGNFFTYATLAAIYGQLGERERASTALKELRALKPDFAVVARQLYSTWNDAELTEHIIDGLRKAGLQIPDEEGVSTPALTSSTSSDLRSDGGFWVAVLPFKSSGSNLEITTLAEGLSEEIVTGLSRFSYLRVISRSSTSRFTREATDIRIVGKELGARYVIEGTLRQAGSLLRVSVQLVDTNTGAHLWAENYNRTFTPEAVFELQDELVPRIVSTVADWYGVLPHSMSESVRLKPPDQLTPYEALLRSFGYFENIVPEEHALVRTGLERAVAQEPGNADAWAMLSMLFGEEHRFGFNVKPDSLGRSLDAARRAVGIAHANHFAWLALAQALYFRKELEPFRDAAERAMALNPMDGSTVEYLGHLIAFSGNWERGCELAERARQLNPSHPSWYWSVPFLDAYRKGDYVNARTFLLKGNPQKNYLMHALLAAVQGQLGESEAAARHLREVLTMMPDFPSIARDEFSKWYQPELVDQLMDGLRKAGLETVPAEPLEGKKAQSGIRVNSSTTTSLLVLPFTNTSADEENEYFCDGLTEELISDLSKVRSLRVISRNSAMRLKGTTKDTKTIASELSVQYVLSGSVRKVSQNLRISVELIDGTADANLWSEKYQGTLEDIFEMQESVSRSIVEALKITLSDDEQRQIAERPIADVRAYDLYLKARAHFLKGVPEALDRSIELLNEGLDIIGENELLYAALGYTYYVYFRWISKLNENYLRLANECMEKTFALNPSSSHAFALNGLLSYSNGDITQSIKSLKHAVVLDPQNTEALFWLTINNSHVGNSKAAKKYVEELLQLDPLLPINTLIKGFVYVYDGDFLEALPWIEQGFAMDPSSPLLIWSVAIGKAWCGKTDEAITHIDDLARVAPDWVYTQHGLFLKYALRGEKELALQYDSHELAAEARRDCHFALHVAHCFALIRENERAFEFLELAVRKGMLNHRFLGELDPLLENIRHDERFRELMQEAKELSRETAAMLE